MRNYDVQYQDKKGKVLEEAVTTSKSAVDACMGFDYPKETAYALVKATNDDRWIKLEVV